MDINVTIWLYASFCHIAIQFLACLSLIHMQPSMVCVFALSVTYLTPFFLKYLKGIFACSERSYPSFNYVKICILFGSYLWLSCGMSLEYPAMIWGGVLLTQILSITELLFFPKHNPLTKKPYYFALFPIALIISFVASYENFFYITLLFALAPLLTLAIEVYEIPFTSRYKTLQKHANVLMYWSQNTFKSPFLIIPDAWVISSCSAVCVYFAYLYIQNQPLFTIFNYTLASITSALLCTMFYRRLKFFHSNKEYDHHLSFMQSYYAVFAFAGLLFGLFFLCALRLSLLNSLIFITLLFVAYSIYLLHQDHGKHLKHILGYTGHFKGEWSFSHDKPHLYLWKATSSFQRWLAWVLFPKNALWVFDHKPLWCTLLNIPVVVVTTFSKDALDKIKSCNYEFIVWDIEGILRNQNDLSPTEGMLKYITDDNPQIHVQAFQLLPSSPNNSHTKEFVKKDKKTNGFKHNYVFQTISTTSTNHLKLLQEILLNQAIAEPKLLKELWERSPRQSLYFQTFQGIQEISLKNLKAKIDILSKHIREFDDNIGLCVDDAYQEFLLAWSCIWAEKPFTFFNPNELTQNPDELKNFIKRCKEAKIDTLILGGSLLEPIYKTLSKHLTIIWIESLTRKTPTKTQQGKTNTDYAFDVPCYIQWLEENGHFTHLALISQQSLWVNIYQMLYGCVFQSQEKVVCDLKSYEAGSLLLKYILPLVLKHPFLLLNHKSINFFKNDQSYQENKIDLTEIHSSNDENESEDALPLTLLTNHLQLNSQPPSYHYYLSLWQPTFYITHEHENSQDMPHSLRVVFYPHHQASGFIKRYKEYLSFGLSEVGILIASQNSFHEEVHSVGSVLPGIQWHFESQSYLKERGHLFFLEGGPYLHHDTLYSYSNDTVLTPLWRHGLRLKHVIISRNNCIQIIDHLSDYFTSTLHREHAIHIPTFNEKIGIHYLQNNEKDFPSLHYDNKFALLSFKTIHNEDILVLLSTLDLESEHLYEAYKQNNFPYELFPHLIVKVPYIPLAPNGTIDEKKCREIVWDYLPGTNYTALVGDNISQLRKE